MTTQRAAHDAIMIRLAATSWSGLSGYSEWPADGTAPAIVFGNVNAGNDGSAPLPRIEVYPFDSREQDATLKGGTDVLGQIDMAIFVRQGLGSAEWGPIFDTLRNRFTRATRFDGVEVRQPPQWRQGYPDGNAWRVPVILRYRAPFTAA